MNKSDLCTYGEPVIRMCIPVSLIELVKNFRLLVKYRHLMDTGEFLYYRIASGLLEECRKQSEDFLTDEKDPTIYY